MLRNLTIGLTTMMAAAAAAHAAPADDVQAAAKKLAASSYTWKSTSEGGQGGRGGQASTGKVDKDGLAHVTLTMRDTAAHMLLKDGKGAVKVGDGAWQSLAEAGQAAGDQPNAGRFIGWMAQSFKTPAAQAEGIAGKVKELKKTDEGYAGELSEDAVKELMPFGGGRRGGAGGGGGGNAPQIKNPKGDVLFGMKDGALTKVRYTVQGTVTFNGEDREINRTTTVELTDVGSTKVDVPAEAKDKLK